MGAVNDRIAEGHDEGIGAGKLPTVIDRVRQAGLPRLADVEQMSIESAVAKQAGASNIVGFQALAAEAEVEMILDGPFVPAGDNQHVLQTDPEEFLQHVLNGGLAAHRQHFLGLGFGRGQQPRAPARGWN
jgi:hypothetical protein